MKTKKYKKIIVEEKHNIEKIISIINAGKPYHLVLESASPMFNLKTQYLAQHIIKSGWRETCVKLTYKGNLFKVMLSNDSPADAHDAEGFLSGSLEPELTADSRDETE